MNIIVNNLLVNYERRGKGPAVLLLHGWGDTLKTFDLLANGLAERFEIITVDLPGFGGSQVPSQVWGLEEYAHFVSDFLRKIKVSDLCVIVGHSNGGAVAIKGLADGSLTAGKLVLVASAGIRDRNTGRKHAWKAAAKVGKIATSVLPSGMRQSLRRRLYDRVGSDLLVVPHMQETFKRVVSEDIQSQAVLLKQPTLVVYGTEDEATPPVYGEIFSQAIEHSELLVIEGAGHFIHQEIAQKVGQAIEEFLG